MKKNIIKIMLDLVMAVILVLLFNSHVSSMAFHEIAGLFICVLFIIHCLLNRKWITAITEKFFSKSLPPRVRFGYIINLLLLISFLLIIISGIKTSQVLFPSANAKDSPWRNVHHFFAGISIILVGIHLGLHWNFVSNMLNKMIRVPKRISKPLSMIFLLIVLVFGVYSISTSNFKGWLTAPFTTETKSESYTDVKENTSDSGAHTPKNDENKNGREVEPSTPKAGEEPKQGDSDPNVHMEKKLPEGSPITVLSTIATFMSIIGVFAAAAYYLDKLFSRRKKRLWAKSE
ncbi:MAG: DUF4405 domain-containing protein [Ruminiclostridium sp.]